jgi:hypothetical protein
MKETCEIVMFDYGVAMRETGEIVMFDYGVVMRETCEIVMFDTISQVYLMTTP